MNQKNMRYGEFGGAFVAELLVQPLAELKAAFEASMQEASFLSDLEKTLKQFAGRQTPITEVPRFSQAIGGARVFLKREDLLHTGAHKINNALGQCLLAKFMGKKRVIAETGAGQHGVATAAACARLGLQCDVHMGAVDMERQRPNVQRMKLLGARVLPAKQGQATLKEAVNAALRDWAESFDTTHYVLGSAVGPAPFPDIVRQFQSCIGQEARQQILQEIGSLPSLVVACVGGGSNAIGMFSPFLGDDDVQLIGVEAGGKGVASGKHAARIQGGSVGVLHGFKSFLLQDQHGQVLPTHSISAGLDYPSIGPEHAALATSGRVKYCSATDEDALVAFQLLCRTEGIIPALESSHALAYLAHLGPNLDPNTVVLLNLSGRGDKDLNHIHSHLAERVL